ncbi:hypothetical protein OH76DRAFT_1127107 [Lentinus brumalis]|uniref:Uncharacterized protein n=1 Tax=Lentinus brumalis TaxID=2498619 RepID=A0A371CUE8_9APHY|nr:hypothetical protein OH76DRAFT_1127107 [Polyporus brumalis]
MSRRSCPARVSSKPVPVDGPRSLNGRIPAFSRTRDWKPRCMKQTRARALQHDHQQEYPRNNVVIGGVSKRRLGSLRNPQSPTRPDTSILPQYSGRRVASQAQGTSIDAPRAHNFVELIHACARKHLRHSRRQWSVGARATRRARIYSYIPGVCSPTTSLTLLRACGQDPKFGTQG